MKKAYAYLRVSGKSQLGGDGFLRQEQVIREYADTHAFKILGVYKEEAISGTTDETERPAFQEMLSAILKNGVRTIIIEGMDRLARDLQVQTALITYIASKDITLISARTDQDITEAVLNDPMQRALVQIQGVFAELEKNLLVKKLRAARERKRDKQGKCEGRKSYREAAPETVKRIRQLRRKPKGMGGRRKTYQEIADILNGEGVPTLNGQPWTLQTVRHAVK